MTIHEQELVDGYCPECWETRGERDLYFEEILPKDNVTANYNCETCGMRIDLE